MITKDDIATYRATYPREFWELVARKRGYSCVAPLGAVLAVNALCDAYEEIEKQRDELMAALKEIRDDFDCDSDAHKYGTTCRCCLAKKAIARVKGKQ